MIQRHQWTHTGAEVLIVRYVSSSGASSRGFIYPLTVGARVEAPDWDTSPECGGGLHGWPWGFSLGDGAEPDWAATWLVLGADPKDAIDLGGKVKCRAAVVRYVGDWHGATAFVLAGQMAWVAHAARGAASATGLRGAASATGASGAASATGWSGAASATGESGAASATGDASAAVVTGINGRAMAGEGGCIALAFERNGRISMRCARVGRGYLKPLTWYRLDARGRFEATGSVQRSASNACPKPT